WCDRGAPFGHARTRVEALRIALRRRLRLHRGWAGNRAHHLKSRREETLMDIKGHAAIVTGGGSGLGAATAAELAKAGAKVALLDVNMDAANAHAKAIGAIAIKCDVADSASAEAAINEANGKNG